VYSLSLCALIPITSMYAAYGVGWVEAITVRGHTVYLVAAAGKRITIAEQHHQGYRKRVGLWLARFDFA